MREPTTDPGLVTRLEDGWMYVKVPVGSGCHACPRKTQCTFSGPKRAYRTFRIRRHPECNVGDRILVEVPGSVLGIAAIVLLLVPVMLLLAGYALLGCCLYFPYATPLLWVIGIAVWLTTILVANTWMDRSTRFNERVTPVDRHSE